jgi:molybdate transport system substrate-binding protein
LGRTIKVFGGGAAQGLVEELRPSFESETGLAIEGVFSAVGAMRARLVAGEPADVVILTSALIADLARDGHVTAESAANVGTVDTAVAVRRSDALPPIGDAGQLRTALLAADAIHFPDPQQATAGIHFAKVLRDLGIWDTVADRLRPAPNGATAMRELAGATSRHPIGCTQATEIIATPGIVLVGSLPEDCALATVYTAAVGARTEAPVEAVRLVGLLTDDAGRPARRRLGFI